MVKKSAKPRSVDRFRVFLGIGSLLIAVLVMWGAVYVTTADNPAYAARSLLVAATSYIDVTPSIVIYRNDKTPLTSILPKDQQVIAVFTVSTNYFLQSKSQITYLPVIVELEKNGTSIQASNLSLRYAYFDPTGYRDVILPVTVTSQISPASSTVQVYTLVPKVPLTVLPEAARPFATLSVIAYPSYSSVYTPQNAPVPKIRSYIPTANATEYPDTSTATANLKPVKVNVSNASGAKLAILGGYGYGYGVWDQDSNGALAASDAYIVSSVAVGARKCPDFKKCDINSSGSVTALDASLLLKYAVGSLPPPK